MLDNILFELILMSYDSALEVIQVGFCDWFLLFDMLFLKSPSLPRCP